MLYKCWLLASKHLNTSENFKGWRHTGTGCFTGNRPWFGWLSFYILCFLALLLHFIGKRCHACVTFVIFSVHKKWLFGKISIDMDNWITWSNLNEHYEPTFSKIIQSAPNLAQLEQMAQRVGLRPPQTCTDASCLHGKANSAEVRFNLETHGEWEIPWGMGSSKIPWGP